jgi:hypothetical protein
LTSQLSTLVPEASLPRAFGADSLTYNLSGIAGPAVAAIVSGAAGAATATLALAGLAAVGALLVLRMVDDSSRNRRTDRFAAVDMASSPAGAHSFDGDDHVDRNGYPLAVAASTTSSLVLTAVLFGISGIAVGPFTGAMFTTRKYYAPDEVQAQVFTISAGLRLTMAAAGAALGGAIAGMPSPSQLLLVASAPLLCGALGALALGYTSARKRSPNLAS